MLKIRQLTRHKMNVNIPPPIMSQKVKKDEEFFSSTQKYSLKRLKKIWQKVKDLSAMRKTMGIVGPITESDSEDY